MWKCPFAVESAFNGAASRAVTSVLELYQELWTFFKEEEEMINDDDKQSK